jgi:hypothetical protein
MDQYEVTNVSKYIDAYHAQIRSLSAANGGQELADYQYLQAILAACADGQYLEANCSGPAYFKLHDLAGEASSAASEAAHGKSHLATPALVVGGMVEAVAAMPACELKYVVLGGGRRSFSADTPVLLGDGKTKQFKVESPGVVGVRAWP